MMCGMMCGSDEFDPSSSLLDPCLVRGASLDLASVRAVIVLGWLAVSRASRAVQQSRAYSKFEKSAAEQ